MAKVKLLVSRAGPDGSQNLGDVIDVDAGEALRMVAAGQAEAMPVEKKTAAKKRASTVR
jgi:hypothetical protein